MNERYKKSDKMETEQKTDGLVLTQRIRDMVVYALPLIEKWSIPHQKLLGDDIAHCMNTMLELASALEVSYTKKTLIGDLDKKNKALQSYIEVAYKLKYLNGNSSRCEWQRRSAEIGNLIGAYRKWVYENPK